MCISACTSPCLRYTEGFMQYNDMNGRIPCTFRLKRLGGIWAGSSSQMEPSNQRKMRVTEDVLASGSESHAEAFPSFAGIRPVLRNLPPPQALRFLESFHFQ